MKPDEAELRRHANEIDDLSRRLYQSIEQLNYRGPAAGRLRAKNSELRRRARIVVAGIERAAASR